MSVNWLIFASPTLISSLYFLTIIQNKTVYIGIINNQLFRDKGRDYLGIKARKVNDKTSTGNR